jgi:hypothetical protein
MMQPGSHVIYQLIVNSGSASTIGSRIVSDPIVRNTEPRALLAVGPRDDDRLAAGAGRQPDRHHIR